MSTVTLNAYSKAYPAINVNRIRASVLSFDGVTVIASIYENQPHLARVWSFAGLQRNNYGFSLDEIDGGGNVVNNLAAFDVTPGELSGAVVRNDEQYQVGTAGSGLVTGANSAVFDGTGAPAKPDFRGWTIVPSALTERGILVLGLDYSWDSVTGTFTLLQAGDKFQTAMWWNFHFDSQTNIAGNSVPTVFDYAVRQVTVTGNILYSDFGNILISKPVGVYIEQSLPLITTVPVGRLLRILFENGCTRVLPFAGDTINFLRGSIYGMTGESCIIFRFQKADLSNEWRVLDPSGNFANVGFDIHAEQIQSGVINAKLLNGSSELATQYARIYNEVVLNLPITQVCNYDDHATGNNVYLFSLANSANPANAGKFFFPDRRGLTYKNNNIGKPGDFEDWAFVDHKHESEIYSAGSGGHFGWGPTTRTFMGTLYSLITGLAALTSGMVKTDGTAIVSNIDTEVKVKSILINPYILI